MICAICIGFCVSCLRFVYCSFDCLRFLWVCLVVCLFVCFLLMWCFVVVLRYVVGCCSFLFELGGVGVEYLFVCFSVLDGGCLVGFVCCLRLVVVISLCFGCYCCVLVNCVVYGGWWILLCLGVDFVFVVLLFDLFVFI